MNPINGAAFAGLTPPAQIGPAPDLRWLPLASLVVDPSYQRDITKQGRGNVRRIAEAFDWRYFSAVIVSPVEGGLFAIIDGQHRCTAAAAIGIAQVPCQIIQATRGEQAAAFSAINGAVTKVSSQQRYKASLAAGDPLAVRAERLTRGAGITLLTYPVEGTQQKPGQTMAAALVMKLCAAHDDMFLAVLFASLRAAAGDMPGQLTMMAIRSFANVLADHPEWVARPADLIRAASYVLPQDLHDAAVKQAAKRPNVSLSALFEAELLDALTREMGR